MNKVVLLAVIGTALASWGASLTGATDKDPVAYRSGEAMTFTLTANGGTTVRWTRTGDDSKTETGEAKADVPVMVKTSLGKPCFVRLFARLMDA